MKTKTQQQSEAPTQAAGVIKPTEQPATPVNDGEATPEGETLTELQAENEQLKATIRFDAAHRQITGELEKIGARSPELLFDAVKGELQFGDDGAVQNAAAIIDKLKTAFPEQFGADAPQSIDAGSGQRSEPRITRDALRRMSASQIAELDWNDVKRVLAG